MYTGTYAITHGSSVLSHRQRPFRSGSTDFGLNELLLSWPSNESTGVHMELEHSHAIREQL